MTLSQLRYSSVLIRTNLWHIIDQNEKAIKLHIIWFIKLKNFDKMEKNSVLAIICIIGYPNGSKYTQIYKKIIKMGMGMPKQNLSRYS